MFDMHDGGNDDKPFAEWPAILNFWENELTTIREILEVHPEYGLKVKGQCVFPFTELKFEGREVNVRILRTKLLLRLVDLSTQYEHFANRILKELPVP